MTDTDVTSDSSGHQDAVAGALARLDEDERELIVLIYYLGRSIEDIANLSGRFRYRLDHLHACAIRKLRRYLGSYVEKEFGLTPDYPECPICDSMHREEIDAIIATRDKTLTWKPVLDQIRQRFSLKINCPQRLIGHERYHMMNDIEKEG